MTDCCTREARAKVREELQAYHQKHVKRPSKSKRRYQEFIRHRDLFENFRSFLDSDEARRA